MKRIVLGLFFLPALVFAQGEAVQRSVVKIEVNFFVFSYETPWKPPVSRGSSGTGFIVKGRHILTNAHVVSQANTIRVQRPDQRTDYTARIKFIAHDCDLALLEVEDPAFFDGSVPLELGNTPELNSEVLVIGFPIGGDRVSLTRGIVSRKDMDAYSHSGVDYHLVLQVDAAINPGNSGGPALQQGKVIGVAFQGLTRAQNIGYLIPPPVIAKFFTDVSDGRYDGYIEFGTLESHTSNPVLQKALGVTNIVARPNTGVFIYGIIPGSSADGHIRPGDVLLTINGLPISENGDVEIDGHLVAYAEVVDNLSPGTPIQVEVLRGGKREKLSFPARRPTLLEFQRRNYDTAPEYAVFAGYVFQPVDANLFETFSQNWANSGRSEVLYRYRYYLNHGLFKDRQRDVVLTRRLPDPANVYGGRFVNGLVDTVNGKVVQTFPEFVAAVDAALATAPFVVIRFRGETVPLVFRAKDAALSDARVARTYALQRMRRLEAGESK